MANDLANLGYNLIASPVIKPTNFPCSFWYILYDLSVEDNDLLLVMALISFIKIGSVANLQTNRYVKSLIKDLSSFTSPPNRDMAGAKKAIVALKTKRLLLS